MRLLARAQEAGEARKDTSIDDVIRFIMGITSGPFGSQEQRDRVLSMAIDGIRAGLLQKPSGRGSETLTMPVRRPSSR